MDDRCYLIAAIGIVEGVDNDEDTEELGIHCEHKSWV